MLLCVYRMYRLLVRCSVVVCVVQDGEMQCCVLYRMVICSVVGEMQCCCVLYRTVRCSVVCCTGW